MKSICLIASASAAALNRSTKRDAIDRCTKIRWVEMHDWPVIQGEVLLFSLEFILINLAVDVLYNPECPWSTRTAERFVETLQAHPAYSEVNLWVGNAWEHGMHLGLHGGIYLNGVKAFSTPPTQDDINLAIENALRGTWSVTCERGTLQIAITLAPTMPPKVQQFGVRASPAEVTEAARAAALVGVGEKAAFRAALRATLVKKAPDVPVFDQLFPMFFGSQGQELQPPQGLTKEQQEQLERALEQLKQQLRELMKQLAKGQRPLTVTPPSGFRVAVPPGLNTPAIGTQPSAKSSFPPSRSGPGGGPGSTSAPPGDTSEVRCCSQDPRPETTHEDRPPRARSRDAAAPRRLRLLEARAGPAASPGTHRRQR